MRTVVKNAVSTRLIRRILQRDIAKRTQKMSDAVFGDPNVFTGTPPSTIVVLAAIVLTFTQAQAAYGVGGSLKRNEFLKAKKAIYNAVLEFAPYINGIAKGDNVILGLCTLPLLSDEVDVAALILGGAVALHVTATQGGAGRQVVTNCDSFAEGVGYVVVLTEVDQLPTSSNLTSDGTFVNPIGTVCYVNSFGARKKTFSNLLPQTQYFVYYALTYGKAVGLFTQAKSIVTSA